MWCSTTRCERQASWQLRLPALGHTLDLKLGPGGPQTPRGQSMSGAAAAILQPRGRSIGPPGSSYGLSLAPFPEKREELRVREGEGAGSVEAQGALSSGFT